MAEIENETGPLLGFQLTDELGKEFRKIGTAGYPIHVIDKNTSVISRVVEIKTEKLEDSTTRYQTWIVVEEL